MSSGGSFGEGALLFTGCGHAGAFDFHLGGEWLVFRGRQRGRRRRLLWRLFSGRCRARGGGRRTYRSGRVWRGTCAAASSSLASSAFDGVVAGGFGIIEAVDFGGGFGELVGQIFVGLGEALGGGLGIAGLDVGDVGLELVGIVGDGFDDGGPGGEGSDG